jgi:hypothetical protein
MHRIARQTLAALAAATLVAAWVAAKPVAAAATAAAGVASPSRWAPAASPLAMTRQSQAAARARVTAPGRALLLLSPFGPPPHASSDDAMPATEITRSQAEAMEDEREGDVVWITPGCCGADDAEQARAIVHGVMAAKNLTADAPVLVDAAHPALAAQLVQRLGRDGLIQLFVIARPDGHR